MGFDYQKRLCTSYELFMNFLQTSYEPLMNFL